MIKISLLFLYSCLNFIVAYYVIISLQWYNYDINRVIFKHKRPLWHLLFFILPLFFSLLLPYNIFAIYMLFFILVFIFWLKHLTQRLIWTNRVKRYFSFFCLFLISSLILSLLSFIDVFSLIFSIPLALMLSYLVEFYILNFYKNRAKSKLLANKNLKIIAITASYGKTTIKNLLYQLLAPKLNTHKTPKSINTYKGVIKDINQNLKDKTKIYIAELGARGRGDITKLTKLLNQDYAIIGKIGAQHMQYFKDVKNIKLAKREILSSYNLKKAFIHKSASTKEDKRDLNNLEVFGDQIKEVKSDIYSLEFKADIDNKIYSFKNTHMVGKFNADNILVAILMYKHLGFSIDDIEYKVSKLRPVNHRLYKIKNDKKIIIDDSYNGNLEGMVSSYDLVSKYDKRKILVTAGLLEATDEQNITLAKKIDDVFDLVILTSKTNLKTLDKHIKKTKKIILKDKNCMQDTLKKYTKENDLILFSNDAPNFL